MKTNRKGFTMAELLIVVAIIGVLVAVAIPVLNGQLEKSRQATDLANVRSLYAEAMSKALASSDKKGVSDSDMVTKASSWPTGANAGFTLPDHPGEAGQAKYLQVEIKDNDIVEVTWAAASAADGSDGNADSGGGENGPTNPNLDPDTGGETGNDEGT